MPADSQWSAGSGECRNATPSTSATTVPTTPSEPNQCLQTDITTDIGIIAAYFAEEEPPVRVACALKRVRDAFEKLLAQPEPTNTEKAVQQLHEAVRKLSNQVETIRKPSYASVAGQAQGQTRNSTEAFQKPVPTRHKREITVAPGKTTPAQALRTNKELIEQLNAVEMEGEVVAVRKLQSGDVVLTTDEEQTRTRWCTDTKWLTVLGEEARIKRREFAILAHGVRVNQVQNQEQAITDIYKQNPRLAGTVDILRVAFSKKLIRSGRKTGPLIVSVAEPEQANRLIDAGLILGYELHSCEPYDGNCIVTQCFNCFAYGHLARNCRNTARCGSCGAPGHATNDCLGIEDREKHRCVPCRGNHQSWARECPVRKKQVAAAQAAYNIRPTRYQENRPSSYTQTRSPRKATTTTASIVTPIVTETVNRELTPYEEPWIVTRNKRVPSLEGSSQHSTREPPAKRRGRPSSLSIAAREISDIRSFSQYE